MDEACIPEGGGREREKEIKLLAYDPLILLGPTC